MKNIILSILSVLVLTSCATKKQEVEINVLAAASLTDVLQDICEEYETNNPGVDIVCSFGGSGALQAQIEEGAPCDVFISAAPKHMTKLLEKDLVNEPKELLQNKIVLITPLDKEGIISFEDVATDKVKSIALGEPESVPVGQYSKQVFENLGITSQVDSKTNYASDVRQVLSWVEMGEVDCGIVYATDAAISDKVKVVCEAPEGTVDEIIYPVATIKHSEKQESANNFVEFLYSDTAVKLFEKYGFGGR